MKKYLYFCVAYLFAMVLGNLSSASTEYGSIYMVEDSERVVLPWRTGLEYSYQFGNPYSNVHGLNLTMEHSIGRFVWVGLLGGYYFSSQTALMNTLQNDLQAQNITSQVHTPKYSLFPIGTLVPLRGHFNFIGNHPIEAELALRLGLGTISYSDKNRLGMLWSIRPIFHIDSQWSIQTGFGQQAESPFSSDSLFRYQGDLGLSFQY